MSAERKASALAARQHAVITRRQATSCGLSEEAIRHLLRTGRWRRSGPGVYVVDGAPRNWEQDVAAAVLRVTGSFASHLTAGALWGLIDTRPGRIEVTVKHGKSNGRSNGPAVHRAKTFDRTDGRVLLGIPVTCPARTLIDLAGVLPPAKLEAVLDRALLSGLVSLQAVRNYMGNRMLGTHRGAGTLVRLLDDRQFGVPESELERAFLRLVRRYRLPKPSRQHPVGRRRIDFAYPAMMVAIELDGWVAHGTPTARQDDLTRQNELELAGWKVLRFTWRDVTQHAAEVADLIRSALKRA